MSTPEMKNYRGNCHCGAFRFNVQLRELKSVSQCDCSACWKKGYLWVFAEGQDKVEMEKGSDVGSLSEYVCQNRRFAHKFCSVCGTSVLGVDINGWDGKGIVIINARVLRDIDLQKLEIVPYDGLSMLPAYVPPEVPLGNLTVDSGDKNTKIYTGNCHCGAVKIAIKSKPLPEVEVKEDDCSICRRNGNVFVYPALPNIHITGDENTTTYQFARKFLAHKFCKTCGVFVYTDVLGPPKEIWEKWPPAMQAKRLENINIKAVNLRALDGVEWNNLNVTKSFGESEDYKLN